MNPLEKALSLNKANIKPSKKDRALAWFKCYLCGKEFQRNKYKVKRRLRTGRKGPFCDKSCVAKYGAITQWEEEKGANSEIET